MHIPPHHAWDVSPVEAIQIQKEIAARVVEAPLPAPVRLVAGVDVAYLKDPDRCCAAAVLWDVEAAEVVEVGEAVTLVPMPYVPGLLSFREGEAVLAALGRLVREPDVLLFDGQGIAHPRRCGIAAHLGVLLDRPSVGCAKSRLIGRSLAVDQQRGSMQPLIHRGEVVGRVLRTRTGVRPVYVSIGHRAQLDDACELALKLAPRYRLPEPTRQADRLAAVLKTKARTP